MLIMRRGTAMLCRSIPPGNTGEEQRDTAFLKD